MTKKITEFLTEKPSYLKKGDQYLAEMFNCSPSTIRKIKSELRNVKKAYLAALA